MASNTLEVAFLIPPFLRVYKNGRLERLTEIPVLPPGLDLKTNVESKDIIYSQEIGQPVRVFIPKNILGSDHKLPLLIYIHGGGFCIESACSPTYHNYLNSLVEKANLVAVSVDYRRAPEHLIPTAYDDAWEAIKWVSSHANNDGPEPWLNKHADFQRILLCGDSAGANITHNMAMKAGVENLIDVKIIGMALIHPFFLNDEPDKLIELIFPSSNGNNDPRLNPTCAVEELARLGCSNVLICVAEKDMFRDRGLSYCEALKKSGWKGTLADPVVESEDEEHVFHLLKPDSERATELMEHVVMFFKQFHIN